MLNVKWSTDEEKIRTVICDPRIYKTITGDNPPLPEEFEIIKSGHEYIVGEIFDEPMAAMVFHMKNSVCWQIHNQVIPEFRKLYTDLFAKQAFNLFLKKGQILF